MLRRPERAFVHGRRITAIALAIVGVFVVLSLRLWDLQVTNGAYYRALAEQNRVVRVPVPADRGVIFDRGGRLLARNDPGFAVTVIPVDLPRARQDEVASRLAPLVERGSDEIAKRSRATLASRAYEASKQASRLAGVRQSGPQP